MKQYTYPDLEAMRNVDIKDFDRNTIPYSKDIYINTELPEIERVLNYIEQAKNAYFHLSENDVLVKSEFSETETTFEDSMGLYFELVMQLIQN